MTSDDAGMNLTVGVVIGLVVASAIGLMFLVSCVASVVKAVRDRQRIKARIAFRRAEQVNGHAPGARPHSHSHPHPSSSLEDEGRMRGRPNILIIHDGEREERVKKGSSSLPLSTSSPRFPSRFSSSSPEDQTPSRRTESTIVAEVACHYGSSSRTTSPEDDDDEGADSEGAESRRYDSSGRRGSLPGQISSQADDHHHRRGVDDVDISGDVIKYRSGSNNRDRSSSGGGGGGRDPNFPVYRFSGDGEITKQAWSSDRGEKIQSGGRKDKDMTHRNGSRSSLKYVSDDVFCEDKEAERSSPPCQGFVKNKKVSSRALARGAEHVQAQYNPRRNSYASAIATSNPDLLDQPTVRRHSDEARSPATSTSRLRKDNLRMRSQCRDGADNPAYNDADDRMAT